MNKRKKPNLLFLYTDEQAVSTMPCYGNNKIVAPNFKKLAEKSFVFENCYCSQSVCTPSRSTILTGLYPHGTGCTQNNIPLSYETKTLPELADFSGYKTGHFGKWHLGDEVFAQHGFEKWASIEDAYRRYYRKERDINAHSSYYHWLVKQGIKPDTRSKNDGFEYFSRGFTARLPEKYSKPAYLAEESTRFIRENKDNPFIIYVNFLEPHMPFYGPRDHQHNLKDITLPPNFNALPDENQPLKTRLTRYWYEKNGINGLPLKTEDDWKRLIANYWGLVSLVDTYIGKILDSISENGIADETIVVFTSDHGDMMGSHNLVAKCVQYQEAVKVPLLLYVPWLRPKNIKQFVSQVDLVPTLLDLMGKSVPSALHGESWASSLEDNRHFPEKDVFIEWNGPDSGMAQIVLPDIMQKVYSIREATASISTPVRTIITPEGWKFNCSASGENELYNISEDSGETRNLVKDTALKGVILNLYERIFSFQHKTNDSTAIKF
jgi:arylsulfatase A-like enzyme